MGEDSRIAALKREERRSGSREGRSEDRGERGREDGYRNSVELSEHARYQEKGGYGERGGFAEKGLSPKAGHGDRKGHSRGYGGGGDRYHHQGGYNGYGYGGRDYRGEESGYKDKRSGQNIWTRGQPTCGGCWPGYP